jgi:hypothetical protein
MDQNLLENEVDKKSLPKLVQPYYGIDYIRRADIGNDEKLNLVKQYGKSAKDW